MCSHLQVKCFTLHVVQQYAGLAVVLTVCNKQGLVDIDIRHSVVYNTFVSYLRIFNSTFPLQKVYSTRNNKPWITTGIKTSCQHKRELYFISRECNNSKLKAHYKYYCLILSRVIKTAKQLYYNNKISKSNNKIKTTWDIIKMETCKNHTNKGTQLINIDENLITNQQLIANSFNNHFLTFKGRMLRLRHAACIPWWPNVTYT